MEAREDPDPEGEPNPGPSPEPEPDQSELTAGESEDAEQLADADDLSALENIAESEEGSPPELEDDDESNFPHTPLSPKKTRQVVSVIAANAVLSDHLDVSTLPPLEQVLAEVHERPAAEVADNKGVRVAVASILDAGGATDYRSRVVMPLRYGVFPPSFARTPIFVRRGPQVTPLSELMKSVPTHAGLSLNSTSLVLGLHRKAVLETEIAFLRAGKKAYPQLEPLVQTLVVQLLALGRAAA